MRDCTHDGLALDLARSREGAGESVACPLSLGAWGRRGACDVAAIKMSRATLRSTVWEVKRTRGDFLADVRKGKYERYLSYCHVFYFAAPSGLLKKSDIPEGCGLTVRGDNGWSGVVAPRVRKVEPDAWAEVLMAHLMAQHPGPWQTPTRVDRLRREVARESGEISDLLSSRRQRWVDLAHKAQRVVREHEQVEGMVRDVLGDDHEELPLQRAVEKAITAARMEGTDGLPTALRTVKISLEGIALQAKNAAKRIDYVGERV